ncbi:transglutaminase-like domain-containing protein [Pyruvatibacter mobilis]|uniref:transglutaminase-like domain-containing protein n=1 Tax=Pyruvatibacter mobilis TaxID=1712261 RepID=UPI003BA9A2C1
MMIWSLRVFLAVFCATTIGFFALSTEKPATERSTTEPTLKLDVFRHEIQEDKTLLILGFNREDLAVSMDGTDATPLENGLFAISYGSEDADWDGSLDTINHTIRISAGENKEEIVIHRQSAEELLDAYRFKKDDGYSIIANSTFDLSHGDKMYHYKFDRNGSFLPDLINLENFAGPNELAQAASISAWLDMQNLTYSPSRLPAEHTPWDMQIEALRRGKQGLQCGDYRNLFTSIALEAGIKIRWIGLLSFSVDGLDDATPYSHAALEVMTEQFGWVFYDPWHNLAFRENKEWLNTSEIRAGHGQAVEVLPNWQRKGRIGLGADRKLESWPVTWPDMDFYRKYFGVVETINLSY